MVTLFPTKCTIVIVRDNREKKSNKEPKLNTAHRSNPLKTTYNPYNLNRSWGTSLIYKCHRYD